MCEKCDAMNQLVARYDRLRTEIRDQRVREVAAQLIKDIEAKKAALHPKALSSTHSQKC